MSYGFLSFCCLIITEAHSTYRCVWMDVGKLLELAGILGDYSFHIQVESLIAEIVWGFCSWFHGSNSPSLNHNWLY